MVNQSRDDYSFALHIFAKSCVKGQTFSEDSIPKYKAAWSQPNTLTCMHNYYRALFSSSMKAYNAEFEKNPKIDVKTLLFFGKKDTLIGIFIRCKEVLIS
jgi:hypothetical protein